MAKQFKVAINKLYFIPNRTPAQMREALFSGVQLVTGAEAISHGKSCSAFNPKFSLDYSKSLFLTITRSKAVFLVLCLQKWGSPGFSTKGTPAGLIYLEFRHRTYFLVSSLFFLVSSAFILAVSSVFCLEVLSPSGFFAAYREINQFMDQTHKHNRHTWEQIQPPCII